MSGAAIALRVKNMLSLINVDPTPYSSHSMRHGGATNLAERGVPDYVILAVGRWRSDSYLRYIQASDAERFRWSASMTSRPVKFGRSVAAILRQAQSF